MIIVPRSVNFHQLNEALTAKEVLRNTSNHIAIAIVDSIVFDSLFRIEHFIFVRQNNTLFLNMRERLIYLCVNASIWVCFRWTIYCQTLSIWQVNPNRPATSAKSQNQVQG